MKLPAVAAAALLGIATLALVTGCSRERIDWKSAEAADTREAYDHFLSLHPDSPLAAQARARIAQLIEDQDWHRAAAADTPDAYRQFLARHADGKWAEEARIRIESFALDSNAAFATPARHLVPPALQQSSSAAPAMPPSQPPVTTATSNAGNTTAPAAPGHADGASSRGYGIQLGAFSTQSAALTEWKRLQTKFDSELHGLSAHAVRAQVSGQRQLFRLQAPVGEEAHARGICAALVKRGQPCVVVLPQAR